MDEEQPEVEPTSYEANVLLRLNGTSINALQDAAMIANDTLTDTVNKALQMYCLLVVEKQYGHKVYLGSSRWTAKELTWD